MAWTYVIVNIDDEPNIYRYDPNKRKSQPLEHIASVRDLIDVWMLNQDEAH